MSAPGAAGLARARGGGPGRLPGGGSDRASPPPDRPAQPLRPPAKWRRSDGPAVLFFIAPVLVGFAIFYLYPTVRGLWWS
ncbi:MAG: hypothetical protein LBL01_04815, partial [Bifidobacteriaceae bacterium]|nr:hypothetical protein [Bifidobacteriaceae bacterium]